MKTYFALEIIFDSIPNEDIVATLWKFAPLGLLDENEKIVLYFQNSSDFNIHEVENFLHQFSYEKNFTINAKELPLTNWNEEWERSLEVIHVSDRIVIKPTFRDYEAKPGQIVLIIDPKMSFGTGEHQTTKLVLLALEKFVSQGMKILDVGTGTAVLAIASIKLGAASAIAIDNDDICFENGIENTKLNEVENFVSIRTGILEEILEKDFDLITANIQKNVLMEIADKIIESCNLNGVIILSGLLIKDENDIRSYYEKLGCRFLEKQVMDEWISLIFKKNI